MTLRRIVLPEAMRAILPGLINDTISMLKLTSIAWVIFVNEFTFRAQQIVGQNFKFFQVFVATGAIYLVLTGAITAVQAVLERRFDLDQAPAAIGPWQRMLGFTGRSAPIPGVAAPSKPAASRMLADPASVRSLIGAGSGNTGQLFFVGRNMQKSYAGRTGAARECDRLTEAGSHPALPSHGGTGRS